MEDTTLLIITLSLLWFLTYWILGGVFFALITILRLGRVHKARFGCLFSLLALACGIGAAWSGVLRAEKALQPCMANARNGTEMVAAVFGCGFVGVVGMFLIWAAVLVLCGFLLFYLSRTKQEPWIDLPEPASSGNDNIDNSKITKKSEFFD